ncbi:MAG: Ig-like domain-containing protein [Actinomycetota bacterium]
MFHIAARYWWWTAIAGLAVIVLGLGLVIGGSGPDDVGAAAGVPEVSFRIDPDIAAEIGPDGVAEEVAFRLSLSEAPAEGESVTVYVLADRPEALTQLNLFGLGWQHAGLARGSGPAPIGDFDFTGFTIEMVSDSIEITVPTFDDRTDEAPADIRFRVVPFDDVPWDTVELGAVPYVQATGPYTPGNPTADTITLVDERTPSTTTTTESTTTTTEAPSTTVPSTTEAESTTTTTEAPSTTTEAPSTTVPSSTSTTVGSTTSSTSTTAPSTTTTEAPSTTTTTAAPTTTVAPDDGRTRVGLTSDDGEIAEEGGGALTVALLVEPAPNAPISVTIDTGVQEGLAEFDVFRTQLPSGVRVGRVDGAKRLLTLTVSPEVATRSEIVIPVFDDLALDGRLDYRWTVEPGDGYVPSPGQGAISFTITDTDTNRRPTVDDQRFETAAGAPLSVAAPGLLASAADPEGAALTAAAGSLRPSNGAVAVESDGSFTYTPNAGFVGTDTFLIRVSDGNWTSKEAVVTVVVGDAGSRPPTTQPPSTTTTAPPAAADPPPASGGTAPSASLSISPTSAAEVGANGGPETVTFRVSLSEAPPAGSSVTVYVLADQAEALTQLDLFGLQWQHAGLAQGDGPTPVGDFDFTGFTIEMVSQSVELTVPTFDDATTEADTTVTYRVVPFDDVPWDSVALGASPFIQAGGRYQTGSSASASLTLTDRPASGGSGAPVDGGTGTASPTSGTDQGTTTTLPGTLTATASSNPTGDADDEQGATFLPPLDDDGTQSGSTASSGAVEATGGDRGQFLAASAVLLGAGMAVAAGGFAVRRYRSSTRPLYPILLGGLGTTLAGAGLSIAVMSSLLADVAEGQTTDDPESASIDSEGTAGRGLPVGESAAAAGLDDGDGPDTATPAADVEAGSQAAADPAAAADDAADAADADVPVVGVTVDPAEGVEEDRTMFTVTFELSEDPPPGGLVVDLDSPIPKSLAEFDVFKAQYDGVRLIKGYEDSSGFQVNIERRNAVIRLPLWDDDGSAVEAAEGVRTITYTLQPSDAYRIDPNRPAISVTISDRD